MSSTPGIFSIVNKSDAGMTYVCKHSQYYVSYPLEDKMQLAGVLNREAIDPSQSYFFTGHEYLKSAGAEYLGYSNRRYYVYLIASELSKKSAIYFFLLMKLGFLQTLEQKMRKTGASKY